MRFGKRWSMRCCDHYFFVVAGIIFDRRLAIDFVLNVLLSMWLFRKVVVTVAYWYESGVSLKCVSFMLVGR
jgi:hypothetical protein